MAYYYNNNYNKVINLKNRRDTLKKEVSILAFYKQEINK